MRGVAAGQLTRIFVLFMFRAQSVPATTAYQSADRMLAQEWGLGPYDHAGAVDRAAGLARKE
jgi:hypothetical protein